MYSHNALNREQTTFVYLFQYMIGNTDWSMPYYHNIKLLVDRKDTFSRPFPVAYDFDMTGIVNPPYGEANSLLENENLTERLYRGYPRSIEELEATANIFLQKEEAIYSLIKNFSLLTDKNKKEMTDFLRDFFEDIKNKKKLKSIFIEKALAN